MVRDQHQRTVIVHPAVNMHANAELTTLELDRACFDIPQLAGELGQTVRGFTSPDADLESLYRYLIEEA